MERLRVAIDCRISDPRQGIGTALLALAKALAEAEDAGQDYTFIVSTEVANWLAPHNLDPCRVNVITPSGLNGLKKSLRAIAPLRAIWSKVPGKPLTIPISDGYIESEAFDLVHFPTQDAYLTAVPSIYQPHDLQHLHYPEFFSRVDYALREKRYRAFCAQAAFVCVQTEWTRQDVIKQYGLPPENVVVIPWGVALDSRQAISDQELQTTISKYALPENFFFYPAVTWPHKNHEVIFRALHLLKNDRKRIVHVYFTGARTEFREELDRLASGLGITEQLHYLR
jgi:glycosyltransferase involved in cell wall biosynthesis